MPLKLFNQDIWKIAYYLSPCATLDIVYKCGSVMQLCKESTRKTELLITLAKHSAPVHKAK